MASKKANTANWKTTATTLKKKVAELNEGVFTMTEELLEGSIATGEKVQDITTKVLDKGTVLFAKQQDMTIETIESIFGQYKKGSARFQKLVGLEEGFIEDQIDNATSAINNTRETVKSAFDYIVKDGFSRAEKVAKPLIDRAKEATKFIQKEVEELEETATEFAAKAEKTAKEAVKTAEKAIQSYTKQAEKTAKTVTKDAKKTAKKATAKADKAVKSVAAKTEAKTKAVAKETKKTVKKVAAKAQKTTAKAVKTTTKATKTVKATAKKVATPKTTTTTKDNLKLINGIGPKLEGILNEAGITTYTQLVNTSEAKLKEILASAGSRYKLFDPSTWTKQAELAAAGKMDELKTLVSNLKKG